MHIVFVTDRPYYRRDHHRFGLDYLTEKGFDIEVWRIIRPDGMREIADRKYNGKCYYEYSFDQFCDKLANSKGVLFYLTSINTDYGIKILSSRHKYFVVDGVAAVMSYPQTSSKVTRTLRARLESRMQIGLLQSIKNFIFHCKRIYINRKISLILRNNPPCFVVTSTRYVANKLLGLVGQNSEIIYTHSFDYDRFLECKNTNEKKECIVFCDSGYYDHDYDYEMRRGETRLSQCDNQWKKMGMLFDKLEEYYKLPVIIAGHPHTKYCERSFEGRKIVFDSIGELARDAKVFVLNTSTAISFAALYDLPVLQVVSEEFKEETNREGIVLYDAIKYQANELGCGFIDLDNDIQMQNPQDYIKKMDNEKRLDYIKKYVIDNYTTDRLVIQYIEEKLKGMSM